MNDRDSLCLQLRSREDKCQEDIMASDLDEEMISESETSVDINELLPREGHVSYNEYGSIVAADEAPENRGTVEDADARVETEVVRKHVTYCRVLDRFAI